MIKERFFSMGCANEFIMPFAYEASFTTHDL